MKTETSKILLEYKLLSLINLENKLLSLLQDYKIKFVFETKRLQDSVWREGLQDYKREEGLQESF